MTKPMADDTHIQYYTYIDNVLHILWFLIHIRPSVFDDGKARIVNCDVVCRVFIFGPLKG